MRLFAFIAMVIMAAFIAMPVATADPTPTVTTETPAPSLPLEPNPQSPEENDPWYNPGDVMPPLHISDVANQRGVPPQMEYDKWLGNNPEVKFFVGLALGAFALMLVLSWINLLRRNEDASSDDPKPIAQLEPVELKESASYERPFN